MKKVLFGGSFDMIHSGHVEVLNKAKTFGDYLVVMIVSDERARRKKHQALPIYPEEERRTLISSFKAVDEAIIVKDKPESNIAFKGLKTIKPDVYVRTNEVNQDTLAEELKICQELDIEMVILGRQPGSRFRSSSRIIAYILENFSLQQMEKLIEKDETK
jgi:cytidyltransferase-like protein